MADRSKWFEITVTVLGIAVTLLLGISQVRQGEAQQAAAVKQAGDAIEVQVFQLVAPHLEKLARSDAEADTSRRIVVAMAEFLTDTQNRENLARIATKIAASNPAVKPNDPYLYRLQEATVASGSGAGSGKWFAVLASLPANNEALARERAEGLRRQWQAKGGTEPIQLFKTRISNNFAVVAGGPVTQAQATELVRKARQWEVAGDAFVQKDKDWAAQ